MRLKLLLTYVFIGLLGGLGLYAADSDSNLEEEYVKMQAKLVKLLQDNPNQHSFAVQVAIGNYCKVVEVSKYTGQRIFSPLQAAVCLEAVERALFVCKKS